MNTCAIDSAKVTVHGRDQDLRQWRDEQSRERTRDRQKTLGSGDIQISVPGSGSIPWDSQEVRV